MGRIGVRSSPTAAVVFDDQSAVGLIAAVRAAGYKVPEDLSVIGFDDSRLAGVPGVALTTIRQDTASLAHHALQQLAARTQNHSYPRQRW